MRRRLTGFRDLPRLPSSRRSRSSPSWVTCLRCSSGTPAPGSPVMMPSTRRPSTRTRPGGARWSARYRVPGRRMRPYLLLRGRPKDFDVATSARPDDVRIYNCRIIGRRFRLAHVLFAGGKVVEVATFAGTPPRARSTTRTTSRRATIFGEAHERASPRLHHQRAVYDLDRRQVPTGGGMPDILAGHPHDEPAVCFRESGADPRAIVRRAPDWVSPAGLTPWSRSSRAGARRAARIREILRLMRAGAAYRSMWCSGRSARRPPRSFRLPTTRRPPAAARASSRR